MPRNKLRIMRKTFYIRQAIRFRRWSRKRCASFCSLGRVVTIGSVKKGIVEASLGKQQGIILSDACVWSGSKTECEEEDSGGGIDSFLGMIVSVLQPETAAAESKCCYYRVFGRFLKLE